MSKITWTAQNNSSYLNGQRTANSIRGAVTAARRYVMGELYGEGVVTIMVNGCPVRRDERSMITGRRWVTRDL